MFKWFLRFCLCFVGSRVPWSSQRWFTEFTAKELLSSDRVIRRPAILEEEEAQAIKAAGKLRDEVSNVSRHKMCVYTYLNIYIYLSGDDVWI